MSTRISIHARLAAVLTGWVLIASCSEKPLSPAAQRGHEVFMETAKPACATCHTFRHAGTESTVGNDLDKFQYSRDQIKRAVTQGVGLMPSQKGVLTEAQIDDVAAYVREAYGRAPDPD